MNFTFRGRCFLFGPIITIGLGANLGRAVPAQPEIRILEAVGRETIATEVRRLGAVTVIRVEGLDPGKALRLRVELGAEGQSFLAEAEFIADGRGTIDTAAQSPSSGTYTGVDPDGLFWSMQPSDQHVAASGAYQITLLDAGQVVGTRALRMSFLRDQIDVQTISEGGLVGRLYLPRNARPRSLPAVITLTGSEGGLVTAEMAAALLANEGFAVLALAYFAAPGLPRELEGIRLEYFAAALGRLGAESIVDPRRIAVLGPSRGGELALMLGAKFPEAVAAVVAHVPSPLRWGANVDRPGSFPAWFAGERALPFLETVGDLEPVALPDGRIALANSPAFLRGFSLAAPAQIANAFIPIEATRGPILMIGGADDQVWPSCLWVQLGLERLRRTGHPFADEAHCYADAGHGATQVPGFPTYATVAEHPLMAVLLAMGGTPRGNAEAQRLAWAQTIQFLRTNLGPTAAF